MESLRRFPLTERVAPVGAVVTHRKYGWRGSVGRWGHTPDQVMVLWIDTKGASMTAYEDLIIEYEEI